MPQASKDYGFSDDGEACQLLADGGFVMNRAYDHYHPDDRQPNEREWDAIKYLFEEWDFGWRVTLEEANAWRAERVAQGLKP